MKILCLSNGHGEDMIALRIVQALQQSAAGQFSNAIEIAALPIVGTGQQYQHHGIPLVGPAKALPSGGFIYMDGRQLARDLRGGLVSLTLAQLQAVRAWARSGGVVLAIGDIVPLLFAWWSGAPYAFVGTAKSDYYLRDERGWLPRRTWFERLESWSGSVYLPWERWLMRHPRCRAVFPRDRLTTQILQRYQVTALDMGNPMMDGLEPRGYPFWTGDPDHKPLTFVLLPGSRAPEAYHNWQVMLQAVTILIADFPAESLLFLGAIAPGLDWAPILQPLKQSGWVVQSLDRSQPPSASQPEGTPMIDHYLTQHRATLVLTQSAFNDCLHQADFGIAMAGTATEQLVGLGKAAITLAGTGPQCTPAFVEAQTRLLGPSVELIQRPTEIVAAVQSLLNNPDRLQLISQNGQTRLGTAGAARRIADHLRTCLPSNAHLQR